MIVSLVPAGHANLISGICCDYYSTAARSSSESHFHLAFLLETGAVMTDFLTIIYFHQSIIQ
jgi:hypothetical protein